MLFIVKHSEYWQLICLRKLEEAIIVNSEVWELDWCTRKILHVLVFHLICSLCGVSLECSYWSMTDSKRRGLCELAGSEKRLSAISLQILSSSYCGHHSSPHLTISRKNRYDSVVLSLWFMQVISTWFKLGSGFCSKHLMLCTPVNLVAGVDSLWWLGFFSQRKEQPQ